MKKMSFMAACIDFFGLREGQTKVGFGKEVKALSDDDRKEITAGLEQNGYEIQSVTTIKNVQEVALA